MTVSGNEARVLRQSEGAGITVDSVSHEFVKGQSLEPLLVLDGITARFEAGSFVSIVGRSGCGKSTILRIISGLLAPARGSVLLGAEEIRGPRAELGMVFQADAVFPWLTVRKNIEYGLRSKGLKRSERAEIANYWCEVVGLKAFSTSYPKELSGGMRKRVDLARVYAKDPSVLLMDEPFGALDAQTKNRMQEEVLRLWSGSDKTIIFVTHDLDEATFLSDRVLVLSANPGQIFDTVPIGLPRPRTDELRVDSRFLEEKRKLWNVFQDAEHGLRAGE